MRGVEEGMKTFKVGDIVFFDKWKLCIWEITKLDTAIIIPREIATLKLLGGRALPPECNKVLHTSTDALIYAERFLNEMEILAWSSLECAL